MKEQVSDVRFAAMRNRYCVSTNLDSRGSTWCRKGRSRTTKSRVHGRWSRKAPLYTSHRGVVRCGHGNNTLVSFISAFARLTFLLPVNHNQCLLHQYENGAIFANRVHLQVFSPIPQSRIPGLPRTDQSRQATASYLGQYCPDGCELDGLTGHKTVL